VDNQSRSQATFTRRVNSLGTGLAGGDRAHTLLAVRRLVT